jgi:Kef-type K+ transport system membrane component KefB
MIKRPNKRHRALARSILIAYEVIALTYIAVVIVTESVESAVRPIMLAILGVFAFAIFGHQARAIDR